MTSSAPIERTRSIFAVLHTPVTLAPIAAAICTANVPTPPAAPMTRTCCPAASRPLSRRACTAVTAEVGSAAACSELTVAGLATTLSSAARAYSANDPSQAPKTSSPGLNPVTCPPTASTVPATSQPRTCCLGRRRPNPITRTRYGRPLIRCHTLGSTPAARTRTRTSISDELSCRESRGHDNDRTGAHIGGLHVEEAFVVPNVFVIRCQQYPPSWRQCQVAVRRSS